MSGRRRGQWVRACGTAEWFAHLLLGDCFALQGALLLAREHFEQAWQYYEEVSKKQPADTDIYAAYAAVTSRALLAPVLFMLGYPERARRTNHAALTLAEQHPHPYGTATVWYFTAALHLSRQEWRQASEWAHRVIALATDYGFPQWIASGLIAAGGAQVELENVLIANMEQMVAEGSVLRDHLSLHFTKVKWRYSQQKIGGGMSGQTAGGWDLGCNKSCA